MTRSANDEGNNAAEADPPAPEHRGQGDVADRADEAEHGDECPMSAPHTSVTPPCPVRKTVGPHRNRVPPGTERAPRSQSREGGPSIARKTFMKK